MTERRLLHIYSRPDPEADRIKTMLAELGIGLVRAEDCFAGMAQLVREGPGAFEALLVCLDGLTREDEEFFHIASRRHRQSPIYLHGTESGTLTAEQAVQAGARRRIEAGDLTALFPSRHVPAPVAQPPVQPASPAKLDDLLVDEIVRPLEERLNAELDQSNAPPPDDKLDDERDDLEPGEIPARRSEASNQRQRPEPISKGAPDNSAAERERSSLVTPEELQALIGDQAGLDDDPNMPGGGEEN
jgi:hypothetical protein